MVAASTRIFLLFRSMLSVVSRETSRSIAGILLMEMESSSLNLLRRLDKIPSCSKDYQHSEKQAALHPRRHRRVRPRRRLGGHGIANGADDSLCRRSRNHAAAQARPAADWAYL